MNEYRIQAFGLGIFAPNERSQVYITDENRAGGWSRGEACRELGARPAEEAWPWPTGTQTQAGPLRPVRWQRPGVGSWRLELARKERMGSLYFLKAARKSSPWCWCLSLQVVRGTVNE